MRRWFTRAGAPVDTRFVKRFDPEHWTVDFPRGAMASVVTGATAHQLSVEARFLRMGDLVGLIWSSVDVGAHPAQARATSKNYSGCKLSFRWQSTGLMALDVTNGPTLTIEGRDALGAAKIWLVRLWNYAVGSGSDAVVSLDFDAMDAGYALPSEAVRVDARDIDRMFISLVAPDYVKDSTALRSSPAAGRVTVSNMASDGSGSVLKCGDALSPENGLGIATAYDDMYNVAPSRVVEGLVRAGFRGTINHYVGMSHYPALGSDGKVDPALNMCAPAKEWHRELARCAKLHGYRLIWSLSFELLDMFCPDAWKQRDRTGNSAATGYAPPSTLVSPASSPGIAYFGRIAAELVGLSVEQGLVPRFQVGEPWWWVDASGKIYLYDPAAVAAFGGAPVAIDDVGASLSAGQKSLLDLAGVKLAAATGQVVAAAKAAAAGTVSHVLAYLPGLLDPARPEVRRANLPVGWAKPAFDVLQLEEYEWVTGARSALRASARSAVEARLGYARNEQHYLSGFASSSAALGEWDEIVAAAGEARALGVAEVMIWAWPQVARDGLVLMDGEDEVDAFVDLDFPIAIGQQASVSPGFSTNIVTSAGGSEFRNANWQQARLRFDAGPGVRGEAELGVLLDFFRARRGPAVGFRFRDPFDSSSGVISAAVGASDQLLGTGDGATTRFGLTKTYAGGEARRITRPVAGSVVVSVAGVPKATGWSLLPLGIVQFDVAPVTGAAVTAGFRFDVPVRFAEDRIEVSRASFAAGEAPSVPLIEIREG